jgi:hypothetical protein
MQLEIQCTKILLSCLCRRLRKEYIIIYWLPEDATHSFNAGGGRGREAQKVTVLNGPSRGQNPR